MQENPIYPDIREWTFTDKRSAESRTFQQAELTIDGEMQAFRLVGDAIAELRAADFPFDRLSDLFPDDGDLTNIDLALVHEMLTVIASKASLLLTRGALIMLGVFEFDEDGKRNPEYQDTYKFLRRVLHTADVVEMIETFVQQNDIERLRAPFSRAWAAVTTPMTKPPEALTDGSTTGMTHSIPSSRQATAIPEASDVGSPGGSSTAH